MRAGFCQVGEYEVRVSCERFRNLSIEQPPGNARGLYLCMLPDDLKRVGRDFCEIELGGILIDKLLKVFFDFTLKRDIYCAVLCCASN